MFTLEGELGGRAAGQAARLMGGSLAARVAWGTLSVATNLPAFLLMTPGN